MVLRMTGIHLLRITLKICAISRDPLSERHLNEHINLIVPDVMRDRPSCVRPRMGSGFTVCLNLMLSQW